MRIVYTLSCLAAFALVGCGPGSGSITGTVTYQNKPLPGGTVTFLSSDNKVKSAPIGPDGSYKIDKVTAGPAKIAVKPPIAAPKMMGGKTMNPSAMGAPGGAAPSAPADSKPINLPQQYQDVEKSGLTYTVEPKKQEHNIDLK